MFNGLRRHILLAALTTLAAVLLTACSGSSGSSPTAGPGPATTCIPSDPTTLGACGSVLVAITDAEGDFTTYTVDLLSVSLVRADGTVVETLPATTRVDFAALTDMTELLNVATMAPGQVVMGRLKLDYSDAEIYVEAGGDIVPATLVDTAGAPLGIVDIDIELATGDDLMITRGGTAFLSIDFDLEASHDVDTSTVPVQVVARPYLVAEVRPVDEKQMRVRGGLIAVDPVGGSYDIRVRPWHRRIGDHGVFTVHTTSTTEFEVNGVPYVGQAGLDAMVGLPEGALTVAFGTLDLGTREFTATVVHAADSVGGDKYAAVHGNIVSRTDTQLVVRGAIAIHRDRRADFRRTVIVEIGPDTVVSKVGDRMTDYDTQDLSVGQRIVAMGQFPDVIAEDADPLHHDIALVLDATKGRVRMLVTRLYGTVNSVGPEELELTLRAIDRLGIGMFNFAGTGKTPMEDADPAHYQVRTGTLALDAVELDRAVRVLGFVTRYGESPPDFYGRTVIPPRDIPAVLGIGWGSGGTGAPFTMMSEVSLVLDLDNPNIGVRHHMLVGDRLIDLFALPASPGILPSPIHGTYGIWEPGHIELFNGFDDFTEELALRLGEGDLARSLAAYGAYDEIENTLTSPRVVVHMLPGQ